MLSNASDPGLCSDLLESINEDGFWELLKNLFATVLKKNNKITKDEVGFVCEGLNIWTSFVSFNPHVLKELYENDNFVEVLVNNGLVHDSSDMRIAFKDAINFICINIISKELPAPPA